jgi:predicted RNase H-like HicB family nuclease
MKPSDRYHKFVQWSEEDQHYLGYCPDLFPYGAVCHGVTETEAFGKLCEIVVETVEAAGVEGLPLPEPKTRPMRELGVA